MPTRKTRSPQADRFDPRSDLSPDSDHFLTELKNRTQYVDWDTVQAPPPGGDRWTTYDHIGIQLGPHPVPDWVITSGDAYDTELGVLKTGKEADVFLISRTGPPDASGGRPQIHLAAKRYRSTDHKLFRRDASYTAGRRHRKTREQRAIERGTRFGRQVSAGMWADAEWEALTSLWAAGVRVPYPVSHDSAEILMEFISDADGAAAPRLAQVRPTPAELDQLWEQFSQLVLALADRGLTHGDLSPFNLLVAPANGVAHAELVMIDLPQVVDVISNPEGMDFLIRDVTTVAHWFSSRGRGTDPDELVAEAMAALF